MSCLSPRMRRTAMRAISASTIFFLCAPSVFATNYFWAGNSPNRNSWEDPLNWSLTVNGGGNAGAPTSTDIAIFTSATGSKLVRTKSAIRVAGIVLASTWTGSILQGTGTLSIGSSGLKIGSGYLIGGNAGIGIAGNYTQTGGIVTGIMNNFSLSGSYAVNTINCNNNCTNVGNNEGWVFPSSDTSTGTTGTSGGSGGGGGGGGRSYTATGVMTTSPKTTTPSVTPTTPTQQKVIPATPQFKERVCKRVSNWNFGASILKNLNRRLQKSYGFSC